MSQGAQYQPVPPEQYPPLPVNQPAEPVSEKKQDNTWTIIGPIAGIIVVGLIIWGIIAYIQNQEKKKKEEEERKKRGGTGTGGTGTGTGTGGTGTGGTGTGGTGTGTGGSTDQTGEVFFVTATNGPLRANNPEDVDRACRSIGTGIEPATIEQVQDSWEAGIEICADIAVKVPGSLLWRRPIQNQIGYGCGDGKSGLLQIDTPLKYGVACYGVKPADNFTNPNYKVLSWNYQQWSKTPSRFPGTPQKDFGNSCRVTSPLELFEREDRDFSYANSLDAFDSTVSGRKKFIEKCVGSGNCYTYGNYGKPSICFKPKS